MRKALMSTLVIALLTLGLSQNALEIDPANAFLEAEPGQTLTGVIKVRNLSPATVTVEAFLQDFWLEAQGRLELLPPESLPQSLGGWTEVTPPTLTLAAHSELSLRYRVNVPPDAAPGTHWGAIVLRPRLEENPEEGISIRPVAQLAYILYVNVGENRVEGRITALAVERTENRPLLKLGFENSGSTYFTLTGKVEIRDAAGKPAATLELPPRAALPGSALEYALPLNLKPGSYLALAVLHGQVPRGERYAFTGQTRFEVR